MLKVSDAEMHWLHVEDAACLLWDCSPTKSDLTAAQAVDLFGAALLSPLPPPQQQDLINELKKSAVQRGQLLSQLSVVPEQLPALVENNPLVAIELLIHLLSTPQSAAFLAALAAMDMSLHSMEVVNRLTTTAEVPLEFIHLYVTNCILSCENIKDKYMQVSRCLLSDHVPNLNDFLTLPPLYSKLPFYTPPRTAWCASCACFCSPSFATKSSACRTCASRCRPSA